MLNAREKFGPYMWAPVVNNIAAIIGFLFLLAVFGSPTPAQTQDITAWQGIRSTLLVIFSTAGVAAQALVLFIPLHKAGIRYRPDFKWRGVGLGTAGRNSFWVLLTTFVGTIPVVVISNINAAAFERGIAAGIDATKVAGNAAYTVAGSLYGLPISLIALSITTATFTKVSRAAAAKNYRNVRIISAQTANTLGIFNFLAVTLMIVLSYPLARIFVPNGTMNEIDSLGRVLAVTAFAVIPGGAILAFKNICYAFNATQGTFFMLLPAQIINTCGALLCLGLPPQYTLIGIQTVFIIANSTSLLLLAWYSRRLIGRIGGWYILRTYLQLSVVAAISTIIGLVTMHFIGIVKISANIGIAILTILITSVIISLVYIILCKICRISQIDQMIAAFKRLAGKVFSRSLAHRG
ncbi:lipid II flippase MurJ [Arcanobacterium hippocoleae]